MLHIPQLTEMEGEFKRNAHMVILKLSVSLINYLFSVLLIKYVSSFRDHLYCAVCSWRTID
jgi:hypothetical protein